MTNLAVTGGTPVWNEGWPKWPIYGEHEAELLQQVLTSGKWAGDGPMEAQFQRGFADLHTARHGIAVNSGTMALQLALEALDIGVGDEVIVPVNTWQATAVAVLDVNAVPVLVDIEPETYAIDPTALEAAITPKTRAIIPVHLYCNLPIWTASSKLRANITWPLSKIAPTATAQRGRAKALAPLGTSAVSAFRPPKR